MLFSSLSQYISFARLGKETFGIVNLSVICVPYWSGPKMKTDQDPLLNDKWVCEIIYIECHPNCVNMWAQNGAHTHISRCRNQMNIFFQCWTTKIEKYLLVIESYYYAWWIEKWIWMNVLVLLMPAEFFCHVIYSTRVESCCLIYYEMATNAHKNWNEWWQASMRPWCNGQWLTCASDDKTNDDLLEHSMAFDSIVWFCFLNESKANHSLVSDGWNFHVSHPFILSYSDFLTIIVSRGFWNSQFEKSWLSEVLESDGRKKRENKIAQ